MPAELDTDLAAHPETCIVDAVMFGLCGTVIGKRYPIRDAAKVCSGGVAFCAGITTQDAPGTGWDVNGTGFSDGDPDATPYPVAGTMFPVTWAKVLIAPAPLADADGGWFDPRHILQTIATLGLTPVPARELEFSLVRCDGAGFKPPARPGRIGRTPEGARVLAFDKLDEPAAILAGVDTACVADGLHAGAATGEYGTAQFEVNLCHVTDPVLACDQALQLRRAIRGVAAQHGLEATFMSEPFGDQSGSGLHIQLSLQGGTGRNLFDETTPDGDHLPGHAITGLQASSYEAMTSIAPNPYTYRRFAPDQFGAVNTTWGINSRSVAACIPASSGMPRRNERRIAGAEANPCLVMAALLASVHHGMTEKLAPTPETLGNGRAEVDPAIPPNLWDTLNQMKTASILPSCCGLRHPAAFMADVLPREHDWYL